MPSRTLNLSVPHKLLISFRSTCGSVLWITYSCYSVPWRPGVCLFGILGRVDFPEFVRRDTSFDTLRNLARVCQRVLCFFLKYLYMLQVGHAWNGNSSCDLSRFLSSLSCFPVFAIIVHSQGFPSSVPDIDDGIFAVDAGVVGLCQYRDRHSAPIRRCFPYVCRFVLYLHSRLFSDVTGGHSRIFVFAWSRASLRHWDLPAGPMIFGCGLGSESGLILAFGAVLLRFGVLRDARTWLLRLDGLHCAVLTLVTISLISSNPWFLELITPLSSWRHARSLSVPGP